MIRRMIAACVLPFVLAGCSHQGKAPAALQATGFGAAIVESSGGKQIGYIGMPLEQPVVVQVNDASGSAVTGAPVYLTGTSGMLFSPAEALTDSSGQVTSTITLGQQAGQYRINANTNDKSGKPVQVVITEVALGYQQTVGSQLNAQYCIRCHDPESRPQRVSTWITFR